VIDRVREQPEAVAGHLVAVADFAHVQREAQPADDRREDREQIAEAGRPVELETLLAAAQVIGLEQPRKAEHVIGVVVAEEDDVEIDEPDLRAQELTLRALAAVEQDAIAATPDQRRRGRAAGRRRRARGAQEDDVHVHPAESRPPTSASDAQDGSAVRDLTAAGDGVQPGAAERTRRRRCEVDDRQRAADEAGDVAVVEARALLDRIGEVERDEAPGPGRASPLATAGQDPQRAHGSTSC
jgi:hypothetical protein